MLHPNVIKPTYHLSTAVYTPDESRFLTFLHKACKQITSLCILLLDDPDQSVSDFLGACPHLQSLTLMNVTSASLISTLYPQLHPIQPSSTLTNLQLDWMGSPATHEQLVSLLDHLPVLQSLVINPCHDSSFLCMIHDHCPSLRHLQISSISEEQRVHGCIPDVRKALMHSQGLLSLSIEDPTGSHYNIHDICRIPSINT